MCGIFLLLTKGKQQLNRTKIHMNALRMSHRGEDETHAIHGTVSDWKYNIIFHRLALNGMTPESSQPLFYPARMDVAPTIYLQCNGEIYNHRELAEKYEIVCDSDSDCEIIMHLYRKIGFCKTLKELRGVFAITLIDLEHQRVCIGRDPYGVRGLELYWRDGMIAASSELKALIDLEDGLDVFKPIHEFPAGKYCEINLQCPELKFKEYFSHEPVSISSEPEVLLMDKCSVLFQKAVSMRLMCDRKTKDGKVSIGAFLSGGFDSSVVAALAIRDLVDMRTFSIGFKGSPDLIAARKVAKHIGSDHYECIVTPAEMLSIIPAVVKQLETYDTTTIRAGAFMYRLSQYVYDEHPDIAVLLSGEGADEASGSYKYMEYAPNDKAFHIECHRLLQELMWYDARRGDRCTAGHNREIRVPFLDRDFLETYLSVPPCLKRQKGIEKYFLREMVARMKMENGKSLLPTEIIWRRKEAMSDGVSVQDDSWFGIIQKYTRSHDPDSELSDLQLEKDWYMSLYLSYYAGCKHIIPRYWVPKWIDTEDPSARLLPSYDTKKM